ncbi:MAG: hypothetical protein OHK0023_24400 [Anaerolineae bacterium]
MPPRRTKPRYEDPDYEPEPIYLDEIEDEEADATKKSARKRTTTPRKKKDTDAPSADTLGEDDDHIIIGTTPDGEPIRIPKDNEKRWYVVHCYSGYEKKVATQVFQRTETMGIQDKVFDVIVPTEEEEEVKEGKRRKVERRIFPGYILVEMIMDKDSWHAVRNTPGVTGFVGMDNRPVPLRKEEVDQIVRRMEAEAPRKVSSFKVGDKVRIVDGPFYDFTGLVGDIDVEKTKVRVMVSFFGRETPVELDFLQVEKVTQQS